MWEQIQIIRREHDTSFDKWFVVGVVGGVGVVGIGVCVVVLLVLIFGVLSFLFLSLSLSLFFFFFFFFQDATCEHYFPLCFSTIFCRKQTNN